MDQSEHSGSQSGSQSEDEEGTEFSADIQLDIEFGTAMSAIRPLICLLPADVRKNWMEWVRMLAERGGERRAERNVTLRKMYSQLLQNIVDERFSAPPPASLDLLLKCDARILPQASSSNCWEGKHRLEGWVDPQIHLSKIRAYQVRVEQLKQELIREKTAANLKVNGLNQQVDELTNKAMDIEKSCVAMGKSYQQDLSNVQNETQESMENLLQCLKRAEQEKQVLHTNLQDLNGTVMEMVERERSIRVNRQITKLHEEIADIRRDHRENTVKREQYLLAQYAELKEAMRESTATKELWAEAYEKRIERTQRECKLKFDLMKQQLTSNMHESASSLAQVTVAKFEVRYKRLLKKNYLASRKRIQEYRQKISEIDALLETRVTRDDTPRPTSAVTL